MTITPEQVADLQPGDVVEMSWTANGGQVTIRGPLVAEEDRVLTVAGYWVRGRDGSPIPGLCEGESHTLTVISRAPHPLYVNHPRTEPAPGDVARKPGNFLFLYTGRERYAGIEPHGRTTGWVSLPGCTPDTGPLFARHSLTLLVDGETGEVVR